MLPVPCLGIDPTTCALFTALSALPSGLLVSASESPFPIRKLNCN